MKFSEFLNKKEDERSALKEAIENLRKKKMSDLYRMLVETLRDSSTWYDARRLENTNGFELSINNETSNKIYTFRESIKPQTDIKSYYSFPIIKGEDGVDCILEVKYLTSTNPLMRFTFLFQENISELDVDNIIDTSVKYLEDKADEMLKDIVK